MGRDFQEAEAAEAAVLGCVLLRNEVLDSCALSPQDFANPRHRVIWAAMRALSASGRAIDELTLAAELERTGHLGAVGAAQISALTLRVPTADNAAHYEEIVREAALTRKVCLAASEILERHKVGLSGTELLDAALGAITAIDVGRPSRALSIGELVKSRLKELGELADARARGEQVFTGVPSGLEALDALTGGHPFGLVTVGAGRPGMGKSAYALGVADAASAMGFGVHVFSLEDPREMYADRAIARQSRVPAQRLRSGRLTREDVPRIAGSVQALVARDRWKYEDISAISAEDLVRCVRRERHANNTRLVIVDYLQLLRRPRRYESLHDAHSQNLQTLAAAAKADKVAYLVLSQLTRAVEKRDDKRPQLADLRESGSIEELSKLILGFYRGSVYGPPKAGTDFEPGQPAPTQTEWEQRVDVIVMKNSNGELGFVRCRWDGPTTRMFT